MTTLANHELCATSAALGAPVRLWGRSALELHDAYWKSLGVAVVRADGSDRPAAARDAGLYLLTGAAGAALLDFRKVLEVMGWMRPRLCLVRPVTPPGAGEPADGLPARCGLTPDHALAAAWQATDGLGRAWRAIKRGARKTCIARPRGRLMNLRGAEAEDFFLTRLARLWLDPSEDLPGITRLGKGVFGAAGADDGPSDGKRALSGPLWLGRGRRRDEAQFTGPSCVLADVA
ncbi:MAG TPA: hypothetical protein VHQ47_14690 [Phycisphaerae bacterium]|nr:hypothetical protein [Phycisphaerae bacterium]